MSFLAPLYALGAIGIGLPILFHLMRKQPRVRLLFSSLLFLNPTPPTVTRRSRLENLPLLLLRALALLMLAAAFTRPFLRARETSPATALGSNVVLLLDVSASMQREDLWQQALSETRQVVAELKPQDQFALITFDSSATTRFSLDQSRELDNSARRAALLQILDEQQPSALHSELGAALLYAAELTLTDESQLNQDPAEGSAGNSKLETQIVLVSDLQRGDERNLQALQASQWPEHARLELKPVTTKGKTNAFATLLHRRDTDPGTGSESPQRGRDIRVRVTNSADASRGDFELSWANSAGQSIPGTELSIHVEPGQSLVTRMPDPPADSTQVLTSRLLLRGDDHAFDNLRYLTWPKPVDEQILYFGAQSDQPRESLLYYLQLAPLGNDKRTVQVVAPDLEKKTEQTDQAGQPSLAFDPQRTPLIIVAEPQSSERLEALTRFAESGGGVLWVLPSDKVSPAMQASLATFFSASSLSVKQADVRDYAMLSKINYQHPVLLPFADSRFSDFSKIQFWKHAEVAGLPDGANMLLQFDTGSPALIQVPRGKGSGWLLAAGWQPTESQLALSSKFVPLLASIYNQHAMDIPDLEDISVGQLSKLPASPSATLRDEQDRVIPYREADDLLQIDRPGFYQFQDDQYQTTLAVNLSDSESRTETLSADELERYGVQLGTLKPDTSELARQRQQKDVELEGQQRLWQWLLLLALALLLMESWLSGLLHKRQASAVVGT